jgi:hypothetical protein
LVLSVLSLGNKPETTAFVIKCYEIYMCFLGLNPETNSGKRVQYLFVTILRSPYIWVKRSNVTFEDLLFGGT